MTSQEQMSPDKVLISPEYLARVLRDIRPRPASQPTKGVERRHVLPSGRGDSLDRETGTSSSDPAEAEGVAGKRGPSSLLSEMYKQKRQV